MPTKCPECGAFVCLSCHDGVCPVCKNYIKERNDDECVEEED